MHYCVSHPVLTAVVSQEFYEVQEEEEAIALCITVSGAELDRTVAITVSTEDVTAVRMLAIGCALHAGLLNFVMFEF